MNQKNSGLSRSNDGLTLLEIIVSIALLGTMFVWILQAVIGGYNQEKHSTDHTAGAAAAATILDRVIDCINADPRFFSFERLAHLKIIKYDSPERFEHRGLFTEQASLSIDLPAWQNLHHSELFKAFDITEPNITSGTADLAFILLITDEFNRDFKEKEKGKYQAAASLCKKASIQVYRLKDLKAGREIPIFRVTRTCFLAPNLSLEIDQIKKLNKQASSDDTDKAVEETKIAIAPYLTTLKDFPEAQEFAAALMLISAEMNRAAYECRGIPLPGVATPTLQPGEPPYIGYETMIASLTADKTPAAKQTPAIIKLATLHRRAATRILEAHKRCLGPSLLIKKMVEEVKSELKDYINGDFMLHATALETACNNVKALTLLLESDATIPPGTAASTAIAIYEMVTCARAWDATFNKGGNLNSNLKKLQRANLYNNLFSSMPEATNELESLPTRYFEHLRKSSDLYFELLKPEHVKSLSPLALTSFANQAMETYFALALAGTETASIKVLKATLAADHRLQIETPLLFRDYWRDQVDIATKNASNDQIKNFRERNTAYTDDIDTLIGLYQPEPDSFAKNFNPAIFQRPIIPRQILFAARKELDSNCYPPGWWVKGSYEKIASDAWLLGGFINKADELYCRITPIFNRLDRSLKDSEDRPKPIREEILNYLRDDPQCRKITSPKLGEMLDASTYQHPCTTLDTIRKKLGAKQ